MLVIKDKNNKTLPFEVNHFPDKQNQFKMVHTETIKATTVLASIPDPESLDLFLQCIFCLKNVAPIESVKINYFYGARSDKSVAGDYDVSNVAEYVASMLESVVDTTVIIQNNDPSTAKKIYHPPISVLAPHCHLKPHLHSDFTLNWKEFNIDVVNKYDAIIFPDESAKKRFVGEIKTSSGDVVFCLKWCDSDKRNDPIVFDRNFHEW